MSSKKKRQREDRLPFELNNFRNAILDTENDIQSLYQFMKKMPSTYSQSDVPQVDSQVLNGRFDLGHLCKHIAICLQSQLASHKKKLGHNITQLMKVVIAEGLGANLYAKDTKDRPSPEQRQHSTKELLAHFSPFQIVERLAIVRRAFKHYRMRHYANLFQYEGNGQNWNLCTQMFVAELHLLFVRHRIFEQFNGKILKSVVGEQQEHTEFVQDSYTDMITEECLLRLQNKQQLLCFGPKLIAYYRQAANPVGRCLTQRELKLSMQTLANRWSSVEYSDDLRILLNLFLYETMFLIVVPTTERLDGREGIKLDHVGRKQCSIEYCADILTQLTYFERALYVAKYVRDPTRFVVRPGTQEISGNGGGVKRWERAAVSVIRRRRFLRWCIEQLKYLVQGKTAQQVKTFIFRSLMRAGEEEVYMRHNGGVPTSAHIDVLEHTRPPMINSYLRLKMFERRTLESWLTEYEFCFQ